MLKTRLMVVGATLLATALPTGVQAATCSPSPSFESAQGQRIILKTPVIVWGTIDEQVPHDAHGAFSFILNVKSYLKGSGSPTIEITDNANGEVPLSGLEAGGSVASSQKFVNDHVEQQALVFAAPAPAPFDGQLVTDACTYTVYRTSETSELLPKVRAVLAAGKPLPTLERTGTGLMAFAVAAALLLIGTIVTRTGRRFPRATDMRGRVAS